MEKMVRNSQFIGELQQGLRTRGRVYEACVRSAVLYGAETWTLTTN